MSEGQPQQEAQAAFAPDGAGWIAVLAIDGRDGPGRWLTGVDAAPLVARAGGQPPDQWKGEVVLRDGARVGVGPRAPLCAEIADHRLRLRPQRAAAQVRSVCLASARLELRLGGGGAATDR